MIFSRGNDSQFLTQRLHYGIEKHAATFSRKNAGGKRPRQVREKTPFGVDNYHSPVEWQARWRPRNSNRTRAPRTKKLTPAKAKLARIIIGGLGSSQSFLPVLAFFGLSVVERRLLGQKITRLLGALDRYRAILFGHPDSALKRKAFGPSIQAIELASAPLCRWRAARPVWRS